MDLHHATIEGEIGELLRLHRLTLAVAESATGGMVSARIVNVAGASDYFLGGIVSYANSTKERALGVRPDTLSHHGAVSEQTALEMAAGVREVMAASIGVSDTGIAGPAGGSLAKPVGLFYIALVTDGTSTTQEYFFSGTRDQIRDQAADHVLMMLRDYLRGLG